ncbi:sodium- and chloride-dependent neutral and basic amino acid transporter B(0+)-like [Scyliorhinus canicula]|uniref:sodium- and chloride-dependent neutral and basic amino acid transporter B(0+)-like n=1 Tax=Scyliorhinus canicula TaxID=7830 RepID=UPI0018F42AA2|nr:sodium- and chloride-dependent neutral and basic amino acid transporter B(0+)-like [Scyliorhinus canicula]
MTTAALKGANRLIKDIEMMIGERTWLFWLWWRVCWIFISPCLLAAIWVCSITAFTPPTYGSVEYPGWAIALGWCIIIFYVMWIPIVTMAGVVQAESSTLCQTHSAKHGTPISNLLALLCLTCKVFHLLCSTILNSECNGVHHITMLTWPYALLRYSPAYPLVLFYCTVGVTKFND